MAASYLSPPHTSAPSVDLPCRMIYLGGTDPCDPTMAFRITEFYLEEDGKERLRCEGRTFVISHALYR